MAADAGSAPDMDVQSFVFSRSMRQADHPDVSVVNDAEPFVADLRKKPGKDIWLWGGGELFHSLLGAGLVDGVDVGVMPVLLGGGIPLLPTPAPRTTLVLRNHRIYEDSGIVGLEYDVVFDGL
jgi:dihydrofolate reductase